MCYARRDYLMAILLHVKDIARRRRSGLRLSSTNRWTTWRRWCKTSGMPSFLLITSNSSNQRVSLFLYYCVSVVQMNILSYWPLASWWDPRLPSLCSVTVYIMLWTALYSSLREHHSWGKYWRRIIMSGIDRGIAEEGIIDCGMSLFHVLSHWLRDHEGCRVVEKGSLQGGIS